MAVEPAGVKQGAWMAMVRRARLDDDVKLFVLTVGSYADADGRGIHPGVARLAVDCDVSVRTASRRLGWMKKVGLIELVKRGNRYRNESDLYRLNDGPDLGGHIKVLDPDEYTDQYVRADEQNRITARERMKQHRKRQKTSTVTDTP